MKDCGQILNLDEVSIVDRMPKNRTERRKLRTRQQIKTAALEVMNARGYTAMTIQDVTELADVGYGTFYLYYKNKDEVVAELLEDIGNARMADLEQRLAHEPPLRREYLAWIDLFQHALDNRDAYLACFGRSGSYLQHRILDYTAAVHVDNAERKIYTTNDIPLPLDFMAQFVTGAIWRALMWWLETPDVYTPEQMARNVFFMVYRQLPK